MQAINLKLFLEYPKQLCILQSVMTLQKGGSVQESRGPLFSVPKQCDL